VGVGVGVFVAFGVGVGEPVGLGSMLASGDARGEGEGLGVCRAFWLPIKKAPAPITKTKIIKRGRSSRFMPLISLFPGSGSEAGFTCSSSTRQDNRELYIKSQI